MKPKAIIIAGPTASGKTELAFKVAKKIDSTIINADSMQVYDDLSILTNRPGPLKMKNYDCKLFGILSSPDAGSFGWWLSSATQEIKKSISNSKIPIIVGGTGLYISGLEKEISVIPLINEKVKKKIKLIHKSKGIEFFYDKLKSFDPKTFETLTPNDTQRILRAVEVKLSTGKNMTYWKESSKKTKEFLIKDYLFIILNKNRAQLYEAIDKRFNKMIDRGVLDEIKFFLKKNIPDSHPINKSIGLRHLKKFLKNKLSLREAIEFSQKDTRNYAKRQITWFNNQPVNPNYVKSEEGEKFILEKFMVS